MALFCLQGLRKPAKVFHYWQQAYADQCGISFDIYKDKYGQTFEWGQRV